MLLGLPEPTYSLLQFTEEQVTKRRL